jgi:hypothetical protein
VPNSHYCQQLAARPDPASPTFKKSPPKNAITICSGLSHLTGWALGSRGLQFYTFFGISIGIKRRLIDIAKKITFYFLQNV